MGGSTNNGGDMIVSEVKAVGKFADGYDVMPDGRVFSVESNWRGYGKRELVQTLNASGYPSVRVMVDGKRKRFAVHKMVAITYLGSCPSPAHQVRHLDGDKMNSHYSNLAWGTAKENAEDRDHHGRTSRGHRHSTAVRRSNQAEATRAYHRELSIARARGLSQ
jgi:hypothetical protein